MDKFVARANIDNYRKLMAAETDEAISSGVPVPIGSDTPLIELLLSPYADR
jgi:hypothetical protein